MKSVQQKLAAAPTALENAEKFAASREEAWKRVAFDHRRDPEPRRGVALTGREGPKALLDYWVYDVQIVVEPIPWMKSANEKFLRS